MCYNLIKTRHYGGYFMPVSRGGGFSGGSSGGSFSSNGSSSTNHSTRISRKPFPGATMYVYVNRHGNRCQFYSDTPPKRRKMSEIISVMAMVLISVIVIGCMLIASSFPKMLDGEYCKATGKYYTDGAGIVKEELVFNAAMREFYKQTGIEPYLYTLTEEQFPSSVYGALNKNSLEDFAYDKYINLFSDEGHYMIYFAVANDGTELWLEMAGTDTTSLLDDDVFELFQANMQRKLYDAEDKSLAIAAAMLIMADDAFTRTDSDIFLFVIGIVVMVCGAVGIAFATIVQIKQLREINDYCDYTEKGKKGEKAEDTADKVADFKDYI